MLPTLKRTAYMLFSSLFVLSLTVRPIMALGPVLVDETRVTAAPTVDYVISIFSMPQFPNIDGDRVVWKDDRNGNADIYMYDYSTDTETQITTDVADQEWPDISGDTIVWQDYRHGDWEVYMYDIPSTTETRITNNIAHQRQPSVGGDYIAWMDSRNIGTTDDDIYIYQISAPGVTQLTSAVDDEQSPSVGGDYIVWEDNRGVGSTEIWKYQISTTTESAVTADGSDHYWPDTDGQSIVWMDDRSGVSFDIYHYDIAGLAETRLTDGDSTEAFPAVDGDRTVWTDARSGTSWDVYMWDFAVGRTIESPIATLGTDSGVARISGDLVSWGDARAAVVGQADIYIGEVSYDDTAPTFINIPGESDPTSITGGVIDVSPFEILVYPVDPQSGVDEVLFSVDGDLICTVDTANGDGTYSCEWTPTECTDGSTLSVVAVDNRSNSSSLEENFALSSDVCLAITGVGVVVPTVVGTGVVMTAVLTTRVGIVKKKTV